MRRWLVSLSVLLAAAVQFVLVHGPDGQVIELNVNEISSIREPRESTESHSAKDTNCIVIMTNGKFITAREECSKIIEMIQAHDNSGGKS